MTRGNAADGIVSQIDDRRHGVGAGFWPILLVVALLAASAATANGAAGHTSRVHTLALFSFAAGQTPENLAIDRDGSIYVSLAYASTISRLSPSGASTQLVVPTRGGIVAGVAIDHPADALDIAVRSRSAAAAGIWQIPLADFASTVALRRLAPLPTSAFPNGMSFDVHENLYVADSALGCIWRIRHGESWAEVWSSNALLAPSGAAYHGFPVPGANGVHPWGQALYVSNTSRSTIIRIPISADGHAGAPAVRFRGVQGADDFAFDVAGNLYVAADPLNEILRVAPSGRVTTLATKAVDRLDNPTAVAFGTQAADRQVLYITNAAYFSAHPRPSVELLPVGITGAEVP
jgi:sugar lactone lactonase YvrE